MGTTYFSDAELESPDTGDYWLAEGFGNRLDILREKIGRPLILNSAARSKSYNAHIGGHHRSLHVYDEPHHHTGGCCAVDIRCDDATMRAELVSAALQLGFSCGVAETFVHVDDRSRVLGFPQVVYTY